MSVLKKFPRTVSLCLGMLFAVFASSNWNDPAFLSDLELDSIKGAFVLQETVDAIPVFACADFFMSEELTGECDSPWDDEDDTCLAEACSAADATCSTGHRRWTNEPINVYYMLSGENEEFHLRLNPVQCWVSTECITQPVDEETTCLNPGPDFGTAVLIADPGVLVGGNIDPGIPCEVPNILTPEGCRKCKPRLNVQLGDHTELANQPEVEDCPFGL